MKHTSKSTNMTSVWSVIRTFLPERTYSLTHSFRTYRFFYERLVRTRGKVNAVKIMKAIARSGRNVVMSFDCKGSFCKKPYNRLFAGFNLRTYRDGFPRALAPIHKLLVSRKRILKLCGISILSVFLIFQVTPDEDLGTITSDFTGSSEDGTERFKRFCKWFIPAFVGKRFKRILDRVREDLPIFAGFKAGSYGRPSIAYAIYDARELLKPDNSELLDSLCGVWGFFTSKPYSEFRDYLNSVSGWRAQYIEGIDTDLSKIFKGLILREPKGPSRLARICFLSDRGGKTRVITSCNYFIQMVMNYVHKSFMDLLSSIPTDYTFDHDRSSAVIKRWQREGRKLYCYDLHAATDRFPLKVQEFILELLLPYTSSYWARVMKLDILSKGKYINFKVGQPMGILSSWPVFSFSHHIIVRYCAFESGLSPFNFGLYCLLGDDIIIADTEVAKLYKHFMVKILGVEISAQKSYYPLRDSPNCAEFAKRNYVNGQEVSPLAPDMLAKARSEDPLLLVDLVHRIILNWGIKHPDTSIFIRELFLRVLTSKYREPVTRYMFHPSNLHPLLYRIKGVRDHSLKVYPPSQVFSVIKQDMVSSPFLHYNKATAVVKYESLSRIIDSKLRDLNYKTSVLVGRLSETIESYSVVWDRGLFPFTPCKNVLNDFVFNQPILDITDQIMQKCNRSTLPSIDEKFIFLTWALSYFETGYISHLGTWHAKRVYDVDYTFRCYDEILAKQKLLASQRKGLAINQLFPKCVGDYFLSEFPSVF